MIRTIVKTGNPGEISLDAAIMELAHLQVGDELSVELNESGVLRLTPTRPSPSRGEISKVIQSTMGDYAATMRKLA